MGVIKVSLLGNVVWWRSGVGGGVGWARRLAAVVSCVTAVGFGVVFLGSSVLGAAKASVVCCVTLVSISFAGVSFVCLDLAPLRGDAFFALGLLGLRRFLLDTIVVDRS